MKDNYNKEDVIRELGRRFKLITYDDGISLRTKNGWSIYYINSFHSVVLTDNVLHDFNYMLGKEMFFYNDSTITTFNFPSSYEELCILNDLMGN